MLKENAEIENQFQVGSVKNMCRGSAASIWSGRKGFEGLNPQDHPLPTLDSPVDQDQRRQLRGNDQTDHGFPA